MDVGARANGPQESSEPERQACQNPGPACRRDGQAADGGARPTSSIAANAGVGGLERLALRVVGELSRRRSVARCPAVEWAEAAAAAGGGLLSRRVESTPAEPARAVLGVPVGLSSCFSRLLTRITARAPRASQHQCARVLNIPQRAGFSARRSVARLPEQRTAPAQQLSRQRLLLRCCSAPGARSSRFLLVLTRPAEPRPVPHLSHPCLSSASPAAADARMLRALLWLDRRRP